MVYYGGAQEKMELELLPFFQSHKVHEELPTFRSIRQMKWPIDADRGLRQVIEKYA